MKSFPLQFLVALALVATAWAQQITSPEVHSNGSVTFSLNAPNVTNVQLRCEGVPTTNMLRDDQRIWSFTTEPLEPDIYAYSFTVNGVRMIDPSNPLLKYNLLSTDSQVHVPGPKTLPWEINDVQRGRLHRHFYKSEVASDERDFVVYTPPGYDPTARKRYPVFYLLHGYSDDTSAWTSVGRANVIMDNLIARGQAKPMVMVMPLGYGTLEIVRGGWAGLRNRELWQKHIGMFRETLLEEVMPQVEKTYLISADRKARAIAGLSMGGTESLFVGLNALDRFAWIGAFSSGGLHTNFVSQYPGLDMKAKHPLSLLWIGCGKEDGLIKANKSLSDWLTSSGMPHTWVETPGGHSFRVWRRYLAEFVPLLFKEND